MPGSGLVNVAVSLHFSKRRNPDNIYVNAVFNKMSVATAKSAKMPPLSNDFLKGYGPKHVGINLWFPGV